MSSDASWSTLCVKIDVPLAKVYMYMQLIEQHKAEIDHERKQILATQRNERRRVLFMRRIMILRR